MSVPKTVTKATSTHAVPVSGVAGSAQAGCTVWSAAPPMTSPHAVTGQVPWRAMSRSG